MCAHSHIHTIYTANRHSRGKTLFLLNMVCWETVQMFIMKSRVFVSMSVYMNLSLVYENVIIIRKCK